MMTKAQFVTTYYPYAKKMETLMGVPAVFALAQSALETGWGKHASGNMLFGIKKGAGVSYGGWQGATQLITTTEYLKTPHTTFPVILSGYPIQLPSGIWKYKIKDHFRAYASPLGSFMDWAGLLRKNQRYRKAWQYRSSPALFAKAIIAGGYATDPHYHHKITQLMQEITALIRRYGLAKKHQKTRYLGILLVLGIVFSIGMIQYARNL